MSTNGVAEIPPDVAARWAEEETADEIASVDTDDASKEAPKTSPWDARVQPVPQNWYTTKPPAREWLLRDRRTNEGALARGVVGILAAEGGAGKSQLLAQLAISVSTGAPWLGCFVPAVTGRVLLVLAEETTDEIKRRLWRAVSAMRVAAPEDGVIDAMGLHGVDCSLLASPDRGADPVETSFAAWLRARVARERYAAVLLDPHSRLGGRDAETANAAATRAVQVYESIAATGAATLVAHHTPQWDRTGRNGEVRTSAAARGVTGLVDGARWMLHASVERLDGVDDALREIVTVTNAKSNYARRAEPVVLRRHADFGGALVPLDDVDLDLVDEARRDDPAKRRRAEREAERDSERRKRDDDDDACARAVLASNADLSVRELRAEVMRLRACGKERACDAIARVKRETPHA
jgi:RecA-family ATPase